MTVYYVSYALRNGFVHNWLVAGPQATPVADLDRFVGGGFLQASTRPSLS